MSGPIGFKSFIRQFIAEYKNNPCLWDRKDSGYHKANTRLKSYKKLLEICKRVNPEADINYVKLKINSLRGVFRKEYLKVKKSVESGQPPGEIYQPRIWYYDLLLFTLNDEGEDGSFKAEYLDCSDSQMEIDKFSDSSFPADNSIAIDNDFSADVKDFDKVSENGQILDNGDDTYYEAAEPIPVHRPFKEEIGDPLRNNRLGDNLSEFDILGLNVTKKLQRMSEDQVIYAEALINEVLMKGLLKKLNEKTVITEVHSIE